MKRAYFVEVVGWEDSRGVTAAETPAQAKHHGRVAAKDAGYEVDYRKFRSRRAPKYDEWASVATGNAVLTIEAADRMVEAARPALAMSVEDKVTAVSESVAAEIEEQGRRGEWEAKPKGPLGQIRRVACSNGHDLEKSDAVRFVRCPYCQGQMRVTHSYCPTTGTYEPLP